MKINRYIFFLFICIHTSFYSLYGQTKGFPRCAIQIGTGEPKILVDEKGYPPIAYMSYLGKEVYYEEMAQAGIHLYNIPAYLGDRGINSVSGIKPFRKAMWVGKGKYDFSSIETDFKKLIASDSSSKAIIRLHLDPPAWWEKENPGNSCELPNGETFRFSLYSDTWRKDAGEALKACISWLKKSEYASRVIGIHLAAGGTEEWFYHYKDNFYDQNPIRKKKFQAWLKEKYKTDKKLQAAWRNEKVKFPTADLADISGEVREDRWRDLSKEMNYYDTFSFQSDNLVDHIKYFCNLVKKETEGRLLTGVFYGYHNFVVDPRRGHGSLSKLLSLKSLDYISSPNDYNRVAGEDWAPMAAIKSIQRHGKLWMAENDTRTSLTGLLHQAAPEIAPGPPFYIDGVWLGPANLEISEAFLWKNLGRMLAYNYGGWWFDMWGGWFSDSRLLNVLSKGQELFMHAKPADFKDMDPQVAVVVDEKLGFKDASYGSLTGRLYSNRYALGKMGAPYDQYLREDLSFVVNGNYKLVWFLGILDFGTKEQEAIQTMVNKGVDVLVTDAKGSYLYKKDAAIQRWADKFNWDSKELNTLLKSADVHSYAEPGDVLYAGNGWVMLHSKDGGVKHISLPVASRIIDVIKDVEIASKSKEFQVELSKGETRLWKIIPLTSN